MRSLFTKVIVAASTAWYGSLVILAELLGVRRGAGSVFEQAPRRWARIIARAAGMRVVAHGREGIDETMPHVFAVNHVSIMDIPAVLHALPDHGFLAKRELSAIPLFGAAARAVGVVFIDRENRKSAFAAYEEAANKVRAGRSVLVFPEGTRGADYTIRPFKKGPFVLAIRSGVPIVPVIIHGTIEVTPNGTTDVTPGTVHVHLLAPIPTAGLTYHDRNALADTVRARMAESMETLYGVRRAHAASHQSRPPLAAPSSTTSPSLSS